jgi:predicted PurR-regulated permease PerM
MLTTLGGLAVFGAPGILIGPIIGAVFMTVWQLWGNATDEARSGAVTEATNGGEG